MKARIAPFMLLACTYCGSSAGPSGSQGPVATPNAQGSAASAPAGATGTTVGGSVLFVVNGGDSSLSAIDISTRKVKATYPLGSSVKFPHHISLSPDAMTLLIAVPGMDFSNGHSMSMDAPMPPGAVLKVDANTGKVLMQKTLPSMNHNAAYAPNGKEIWTSQMDMPGSVLVLDPQTLDTTATIAVDHMPSEVTFSADGKLGFVANEMTNDISVIDPVSKTVINTIYVDKGPVGAWSGADDVMYVDSEEGQSFTAIDAKTQKAMYDTALGFTPGMVATAPDGSVWVTDGTNGAVVTFDSKSGTKLTSIKTGAGAHGIIFAPDGKTAFVTNQGDNTVTFIDVASKNVAATVAVGSKPNGLVVRK